MTAHVTSPQFKQNATRALADDQLQKAMSNVRQGFIDKRAAVAAKLPEFEALRDSARDIKNHALQNLDLYLERWEEKVTAAGGQVHWARTADEACGAVLDICRRVGAKTVTKGKSMISEEIALNAALEAAGVTPVETDLGEYIIQLRGELPSHIIAPAVHLNATQVGHHGRELPDRRDRDLRHRHQRGQRRPHADPAAHPHRHRQHREGGADAGGRVADPARSRAVRNRPGDERLHDLLHRAAPAGRSGRA